MLQKESAHSPRNRHSRPMRMGGPITSTRRGNRLRRRTISSRKGISSKARQPMKMPYRSEGTPASAIK